MMEKYSLLLSLIAIIASVAEINCSSNFQPLDKRVSPRPPGSNPWDLAQLLQLLVGSLNYGGTTDGRNNRFDYTSNANTNISPLTGITNIANSIRNSEATNTRITDSEVTAGNVRNSLPDDRLDRRQADPAPTPAPTPTPTPIDWKTLISTALGIDLGSTNLGLNKDSNTEFAPSFDILSLLNSNRNTGGFGTKITGPSISTGGLSSVDQNRGRTRRQAGSTQLISDTRGGNRPLGTEGTLGFPSKSPSTSVNANSKASPLTSIVNALNSISNSEATSTNVDSSVTLGKLFGLDPTDILAPKSTSTTKINLFADGQLSIQNLGGFLVTLLNRLGGLVNNLLPGLLDTLIGPNGLLTDLLGVGGGKGLLGGLLGPRGLLSGLLGGLLGPGGLLGGLLGGGGRGGLLGGLLGGGGGGQGGLLGGLLGGGGRGGLLGGLLGGGGGGQGGLLGGLLGGGGD